MSDILESCSHCFYFYMQGQAVHLGDLFQIRGYYGIVIGINSVTVSVLWGPFEAEFSAVRYELVGLRHAELMARMSS